MSNQTRGFTLIELLIVLVIASILATLAYPQYGEYVKRVRRSEIAALLVEEAQRLERFYTRTGKYSDDAGPPALTHEVSDGNAFYLINAERSEQMFLITATAVDKAMMSGDKCGSFVLSNTGRRHNAGLSGAATVGQCWGQ